MATKTTMNNVHTLSQRQFKLVPYSVRTYTELVYVHKIKENVNVLANEFQFEHFDDKLAARYKIEDYQDFSDWEWVNYIS